ncbi:MAG TPA: glucose-1-phosphate thymidylyltransferase [Fimbriimonadales bacterium]|nr:glucose-1-phosphate thymidylyltransferase [Fimbriimonadales bacterium]
MKGLILAGGKGTRLRPITHSIAKQLVPIANKPVIEFGIESLCEAGIKEIGIIVGDSASEIEEALGDGSRWGAKFTYIPQYAPLGLAHAVKTAQDYLDGDKFIVYLGDNLIKGGVSEFVREFESCNADASILLSRVPNPSEFGVAYLENGKVVRLEEKPKNPTSDYALVGVYLFTPCVFDAIDTLKPSFRGEYEITDAIQTLIDWGKDVRYHVVTGWWKDTGTVEAILEANRLILESMQGKVEGEIIDSKLEGTVIVEGGAKVVRSSIRGPAIIGENAVLEESFIGPYTSIAKDTRVSHSEIEYSIVMEGCCIENIPVRLAGCLIGRGVRVARSDGKPKSLQLVLGDGSSVMLP